MRRMSRFFIREICLLLLFAIGLSLVACSGGAGSVTDTESQTTAEEDANNSSEDTSSEETAGPQALWNPFENTSESTVSNVADVISATYREQTTVSEGSALLSKVNMTLHYSSTFYGHDSAVNHDYMQYGWKLNLRSAKMESIPAAFFVAEVTGDLYADILTYEDGVLTVYPAEHKNNSTFKYNDQKYTSVVGYKITGLRLSYGDPITADLGISGVLRGVADFDRDGRADPVILGDDGTLYIVYARAEGGFNVKSYGVFTGEAGGLFAGDVDGNGTPDLLYIDADSSRVTSLLFDGTQFVAGDPVTVATTEGVSTDTQFAVGDINQDGRVDLVRLYKEDGSKSSANWEVLSLFGRGDGRFGPDADEMGNTNLFGRCTSEMSKVDGFAIGDINGDGVDDFLINGTRNSYNGLIAAINADDPAYDYSAFGMITEDGHYRIYSGGRWYDQSDAMKESLIGNGYGDGDHVIIYDSEDGTAWTRYQESPAYYLGLELGESGWETVGDGWWTGNTLEPEVVYVDGVYHMFTQSSGTTQSGHYGDYIGYASSTDGYHFTRKTDSPVILPKPGANFTQFKEIYGYEIGFNHEEVLYVADDPDGKCFWLYTGHFINGNFSGYVRIRSSDPTVFYWSERERTDGFAQIGNQLGYINDYDGNGNRLFLRITFTELKDEDGSRMVPTLYWSTDGLRFFSTNITLAGAAVTDPITEHNHNCYFLGMFTKNGTGEIPKNEDGSVSLLYLATTSNESAGTSIFYAEVGLGKVTITFAPSAS